MPFLLSHAARSATASLIHRAEVRLVVAGLVLLIVSPVSAQTKSKQKPASTVSSTPKKKARPKPLPSPDDTDESTAARKPKRTRTPTPSPAPETIEREPEPSSPSKSTATANAAISPDELLEFRSQPAGVQKLIESSLDLARQNLTYTFGSADPANGGLDCSGFIYYVLRQHGLTQVPRDSSGTYVWVRKARVFRAVVSRKPDSFEMDELLPGDLLFWVGTYATDHDPPITHTMIYLGTEKSTGNKVMIGSSDGRTYHGKKRNGVSVFDFMMPRTLTESDQRSTFVGYARIPGLRD